VSNYESETEGYTELFCFLVTDGVKHGSCQIKLFLNSDSSAAWNNSLTDGVVWQQQPKRLQSVELVDVGSGTESRPSWTCV